MDFENIAQIVYICHYLPTSSGPQVVLKTHFWTADVQEGIQNPPRIQHQGIKFPADYAGEFPHPVAPRPQAVCRQCARPAALPPADCRPYIAMISVKSHFCGGLPQSQSRRGSLYAPYRCLLLMVCRRSASCVQGFLR